MKLLGSLLALATLAAAHADTKYFGYYIQGQKIGYTSSDEKPDKYQGLPVIKSVGHSVMGAVVRGVDSRTISDSINWTTLDGRILRYKETTASGGRLQVLDVVFGPKTAEVSVNTGGAKLHKSVRNPNGPVVDDPLDLVRKKLPAKGKVVTYWTLDDSSFIFKPINLTFQGQATTTISGAKISGYQFDIETDGLNLKLFAKPDGRLIHVIGPVGMEVRPVPKAIALAEPAKGADAPDLAKIISLKTDKPIPDIDTTTEVKLHVTGMDLSKLPSDTTQTIEKDGNAWNVDLHPHHFDTAKAATIADAAKGNEKWTQPSLYVPAGDAAFKQIATKVVADTKDVAAASAAIVHYVSQKMKYVDGIDLPRDASEILKSKEGVCRDYAVLTLTVLRAAGIPSRLAVGLVYDEGSYYGHAWNEVWDGAQWIGIDPTNNVVDLPAAYIKLKDGNVEDSFNAIPPVGGKLAVVQVTH